MTGGSRKEADERLAAALGQAGVADGREDYRNRLRLLKKDNAEGFRQATEHYDRVVLPALLAGSDPLGVWIEFGITLAGLGAAGRAVVVDESGRSTPWPGRYEPGSLVLFVPEDRQEDVLPLAVPVAPSAAQSATIDLLVLKKLAL
jgi:hypothetical protein